MKFQFPVVSQAPVVRRLGFETAVLVVPIPVREVNRQERLVPFRSLTLVWNTMNVLTSPCNIGVIDSGVSRKAPRSTHTNSGFNVIVQVVPTGTMIKVTSISLIIRWVPCTEKHERTV